MGMKAVITCAQILTRIFCRAGR